MEEQQEQQEEQITEIIEHQKTSVNISERIRQIWEILKKILYVLSYSCIVCLLVLVCTLIMQYTGHLSTETLAKFPYGFHPLPDYVDWVSDKDPLNYGGRWIVAATWLAVAIRVTGRKYLGGLLGIFLIVSLFIPKLYIVWQVLGILLLVCFFIIFLIGWIKAASAKNDAWVFWAFRTMIWVLIGK